MFSRIESTRRSNHSIFLPQNYGSPFNEMAEHIAGLALARLDFERCAVAGEVIYTVEGDSIPTSQQDEEARIATLAHALKKLGNPEDAAEFMRCLNEICKEGDARYRQVAASYYYGEIAERGVGPVLKEMALIAMHLASLNPVTEEVESDSEIVYALREESKPRSLFDLEVAAVNRMVRGRRKSASFVHDEWTEWLNDLEANGATVDELDDAFAHVEALDQYDEGGAIVRMSAHERTFACGRVDHEFTADDLPEQARFLAGDLLRAYTSGVELEEIWDEDNAKLDVLIPVKGRFADGYRFFSRANLELQRLTRDAVLRQNLIPTPNASHWSHITQAGRGCKRLQPRRLRRVRRLWQPDRRPRVRLRKPPSQESAGALSASPRARRPGCPRLPRTDGGQREPLPRTAAAPARRNRQPRRREGGALRRSVSSSRVRDPSFASLTRWAGPGNLSAQLSGKCLLLSCSHKSKCVSKRPILIAGFPRFGIVAYV